MESFPLNQQQSNSQRYYDNSAMRRYLSDLKSLSESEFVQSEIHLNGEAYSILFSDALNFYLVQVNQVVSVQFDANIQVPSAKNVFLFEARSQELGMNGYFAMVFGLDSYALVLIDPQYQRQNGNGDGYKVQWIKQYQSLQPENGASSASMVTLIGESLTTTRMGLPEQMLSFLIGGTNHQKAFELRLSLRVDRENFDHFGLQSVLTQTGENIIYQEPKTITSRISNFISAKIGYRQEQGEGDQSKCVKNVQLVGQFVIIITNKDLIIVRYGDRVKIFEQDFIENMKILVNQQENSLNLNLSVMKNVLIFNYLASHSCQLTSSNQICVSLFARREQVVQNPQSYHIIKESHIIQHSRIFSFNESMDDSSDQLEKLSIFEADKALEQAQVKKAVAFSYEYYTEEQGTDVTTLLISELANSGRVRVFEYSLFRELQNSSELETLRLSGYKVQSFTQDETRELIVRANIISQEDVSTYEFDPVLMRFANAQLLNARQEIQAELQEEQESQQEMQPQLLQYSRLQEFIVSPDQIRNALFQILDNVGNLKFGPKTKSQVNEMALEQQKKNQILQDVKRLTSSSGYDMLLSELKKIIEEQVDLPIDDNHFYNRGTY